MVIQKEKILTEPDELTNIYDALFDFESKSKTQAYPIHKKMNIQGHNLLEWIADKLVLNDTLRILDAGCGTGNSLFQFNEQFTIHGVGLSISPKEVEFAKECAKAKQVQDSLSFHCRDFSKPIEDLGHFDIILAVESLKHCNEPFQIIQNFLKQLKPDGTLLIVDDFITSPSLNGVIKRHKEHWFAPGFSPIKTLTDKMDEQNISYECSNLNQYVTTKSNWLQSIILVGLMLLKPFYRKSGTMLRNLETYEGAILLEKLHRKKDVGYFCLAIQASKTR